MATSLKRHEILCDPFSILKFYLFFAVINSYLHYMNYLKGVDDRKHIKAEITHQVEIHTEIKFLTHPRRYTTHLFLMISGFLAAHSYLRLISTPSPAHSRIWKFIMSRMTTLYPIYLMLLVMLNPHTEWSESWKDYLINATLMSSFSWRNDNLLNLWFANTIVHLTIITPFYFELLAKVTQPMKYFILVATVHVCLWNDD